MSASIPFVKMVGTGNDFLIVDTTAQRLRSLKAAWPNLAKAMCNRRYGVGADGLLVLESSKIADRRMRVFNPDGSEAEMCGNGARCVAGFVQASAGREGDAVDLETAGGVVKARVRRGVVQMRMPDPRDLRLDLRVEVDGQPWQLSYVNTGVPHVVAVVDRLDRVDVEALGRRIRFHRLFQPRGTNVDFLQVNETRPNHLRVRTYERGVEAETLACGTGVTAAAVVHALRGELWAESAATRRAVGLNGRSRESESDGRDYRIHVETKSGEVLTVSLTTAGHGRTRRVVAVTLEGAVRRICEGTFLWSAPSAASSRRADVSSGVRQGGQGQQGESTRWR